MGNVAIFAKAFRDCGIGGRFSKFQIAQSHEWFELINIVCFRVYDRLDHRKFRQVSAGEAGSLHSDDPQWSSHFQTAQKVLAKIVSVDKNRGDNRYYIDDLQQSVFLINRMFVIEVTPVLRQAPEVSTYGVYDFLACYSKKEIDDSTNVKVFSRYGKVIVSVDSSKEFNSLLTAEEFNEQYGLVA